MEVRFLAGLKWGRLVIPRLRSSFADKTIKNVVESASVCSFQVQWKCDV
jgi:hypothetical protein